jgi:hypothetical protein
MRFSGPTYRDWRIHGHDIGLLDEQFSCLVAQLAHLDLGYGPACSQLRDRPVLVSASSPPHVVACPYLSRSLMVPGAPVQAPKFLWHNMNIPQLSPILSACGCLFGPPGGVCDELAVFRVEGLSA